MTLFDFPLLTDENIDAEVVRFLRSEGFDVLDVREAGLIGSADVDLIRLAFGQGRLIVTHDRDFGTLAIANAEPVIGILYLRPGHIDPAATIATVRSLLQAKLFVEAPFVLVAEGRAQSVNVRIRKL